MTKTKLIRFAVLLVSVVVFCTVFVNAVPSHTTQFYVNDYADVLSDETEKQILNTAINLDNETTAQVVVLTVPDLGGEDIADYAVETLRSWGIGSKDKNNGVLIVLAIEERQIWVSVGYGLEETLTDIRTGQLQSQYAVPYYRNNDFETGTVMLFNAIVNEIRTEKYGLEPLTDTETPDINYYTNVQELSVEDILPLSLIVILPVLILPCMFVFQTIKYHWLRFLDKKHGTNRAVFYREHSAQTRKKVATYLVAFFIGRRFRGGFRGGGGRGGFGGGGGFRGGGGSGGGGGAGRSF